MTLRPGPTSHGLTPDSGDAKYTDQPERPEISPTDGQKGIVTMTDTGRLPAPQLTYWDWQLNAACRGMAGTMFFHPAGERNGARRARIQNAKTVCRTCPVIAQCLEHALRLPEPYGIWGGLSEDERAQQLGVRSLRYPTRATNLGGMQERTTPRQEADRPASSTLHRSAPDAGASAPVP